MLEIIVHEVESCLNNKCYYAALSLSLELIDICAYVDAHGSKGKNKERYINWYDSNIGQYLKNYGISNTDDLPSLPYLSGEIIYSLRCNLLHQGTIDKDNSIVSDPRNESFDLIFEIPPDKSKTSYPYDCQITYDSEGKAISTKYKVNLFFFCDLIISTVTAYYAHHQAQFGILPRKKFEIKRL